MDKEIAIYQPVDIEKKYEDVEKNGTENAENSDQLANLIAEIIVENLVRKYRGKYNQVSFKDASEVPDRLKQK
ncbi:hypothetical protein [Mucilaginibacter paludis]|uniref:Uncharacterized protein n=1 Tax=Mucilaginibacter paludis DSM 18603 TaxID=714943 RepID=H1YHC7_9SPHI|nr:hypothetical protein [Mucilaginibacter paludis]EHQ25461.1 hypothetical protein Mucpa_1299 [Mucilaginibacter paludis DSM 18603]